MLFNDMGEQFGLLSGGCLEADIQIKASQVMVSQTSMTVCYDANDEDDMSFLLGIGCGGIIHLLLQPLGSHNNYLQLPAVLEALEKRQSFILLQKITRDGESSKATFLAKKSENYDLLEARLGAKKALLTVVSEQTCLAIRIIPPRHLLVVGGGVDARPLANMAATLGWDITLCDPRPANARREHFMDVCTILRCQPLSLDEEPLFEYFDAAIVMTHNLQFDADAIICLQKSNIKYLALLGPAVRKDQVLDLAGLRSAKLTVPIAGPAGLSLGGELPEEIALSILAECQAIINNVDAHSLSNLF